MNLRTITYQLYKNSLILLIGVAMIWLSSGCGSPKPVNQEQLELHARSQLNKWNKELTDVMVQDIFSPPVASRIYAYSNIAAYEVLAQEDDLISLSEYLPHLKPLPPFEDSEDLYIPLASTIAFSEVAGALVYSYELVEEAQLTYIEEVRSLGLSDKMIDHSIEHGEKVADHILAWAQQDGYKSRNNNTQIIKDNGTGTWRPTPPDFLEPIEPNWNTLRPFVLDSAYQFSPGDPTPFATASSSQFYKESIEVYKAVIEATDEEMDIARFWDCNPNASYHAGHVMQFQQKISPGAHWMLIASLATQKEDLNLTERAKVFAMLSIGIADSFISCWGEKYRTVVIRPETYINDHIDKSWKPILQTPSFPEYTSGHSVASASAASILTAYFGDDFDFIDSTEVDYGLPMRSFASFNAAAEEAAISRLYGGIHYRPAITNGVKQGREIGAYVARELEIQ